MKKEKVYFKRLFVALPLALIVGVSFLPLQRWANQALVLFTLMWFFLFLFTEVFGR